MDIPIDNLVLRLLIGACPKYKNLDACPIKKSSFYISEHAIPFQNAPRQEHELMKTETKRECFVVFSIIKGVEGLKNSIMVPL